MFIENLVVIISAIIVLGAFWVIVGVRHIRSLKKDLNDQWEMVDEGLRKRYDLIPNLIETIKSFTSEESELIEKVIQDRQIVAKITSKNSDRIVAEYDLTHDINDLINLGKKYAETGLKADTNFLELRKEIDDLEQNIEDRTIKYNEMVKYYNKHIKIAILAPITAIWRFRSQTIFEVEK